jgi:hypothetical protein
MAALTPQNVTLAGLTPAFTPAAGGGDTFPNDGNCLVEFKNTDGSPVTVTIATPAKVDGMDVADLVVVVPATTGNKLLPPLQTHIFNDANGNVSMTYSGVTALTVAVFRLP